MKRTYSLVAASLCVLLARPLPALAPEPFGEGQRICFVGDSITHGGLFHNYIYAYYATRFPGRPLKIYNGGIGGWTAASTLETLPMTVARTRPDTVALMLGMNDLRAPVNGAQSRYETGMKELVAMAKKLGVKRTILVATSPYEDTAKLDQASGPAGTGNNERLGRGADFLLAWAGSEGIPTVDFFHPMVAIALQRQKTEPAFTLIGNDRIHPGPLGNLMMAHLFLKSQSLPRLVWSVSCDAGGGAMIVEGAKAKDVERASGRLAFILEAQSLPWPVAQEATPLPQVLEDLSVERLKVTGLGAGIYMLRIDGIDVGKFTQEELASGVNLAGRVETPQYRQAREVWQIIQRKQGMEHDIQTAQFLWFHFKQKGLEFDFKSEYPEPFQAGGRFEKDAAVKRYYDRYAGFRHKLPDYPRLIEELILAIYQKSLPVPRKVSLDRI